MAGGFGLIDDDDRFGNLIWPYSGAAPAFPAHGFQECGRFGGARGGLREPINNARLAATAIDNDLVPAFSRLLAICSGDHEAFYRAVERIGALKKDDRLQALRGAKQCA
ncbi:MAG: aminopeptidase [Notoacmeibacter sp.]|nr:aminopeptidase [Notoacmeibacter sp.]